MKGSLGMYREIENIGCASRQTERTQSRPSVKDMEATLERRRANVKEWLGAAAVAAMLPVLYVLVWALM